jgi:hypothetical protein
MIPECCGEVKRIISLVTELPEVGGFLYDFIGKGEKVLERKSMPVVEYVVFHTLKRFIAHALFWVVYFSTCSAEKRSHVTLNPDPTEWRASSCRPRLTAAGVSNTSRTGYASQSRFVGLDWPLHSEAVRRTLCR